MKEAKVAELFDMRETFSMVCDWSNDREGCEARDALMDQCIVQAVENRWERSNYRLEWEDAKPWFFGKDTRPEICLSIVRQLAVSDMPGKKVKKMVPFSGCDALKEEVPTVEGGPMPAKVAAKPNKAKSVEFAAYCRTFEATKATGSKTPCSFLDPSKDGFSVDVMNRENPGDGFAWVPEYGISKGQVGQSAVRRLFEDGTVVRIKEGVDQVVGSVNPEVSRHFLAGAFGAGYLKDAASIDPAVVDGLRELYGLCLKDFDRCLESPQAINVASAWQAVEDDIRSARAEKKRIEKANAALVGLRAVYEDLVGVAEDKVSLLAAVAPLESRMPKDLSSSSDRRLSATLLRQMVSVALESVARDHRQARVLRERGEIDEKLRLGDALWQRIEKLLSYCKAQDKFAGGIDYDALRRIYDAGIGEKPSQRPTNVVDAEKYVENGRYLLGNMLRDYSGYKTVKERSDELGCTVSEWHSSRSSCPQGTSWSPSSSLSVACKDLDVLVTVDLSDGGCIPNTKEDKDWSPFGMHPRRDR